MNDGLGAIFGRTKKQRAEQSIKVGEENIAAKMIARQIGANYSRMHCVYRDTWK